MVEYSVETWSQNEWIEYLADTADGFSGLLTFVVTAKHVQGTGQPKPRSPVLRKVRKSGPESCYGLLGTVVILEIPSAAKPPVATVTGRFRPGVKHGTSPIRFSGIGQGSHHGRPRADMIGVLCQ